MTNITLNNLNVDFGNFDPMAIATDETINAVFIVDVSPSVNSYANELNQAFREFTEEMQRSHVSEKLMVSIIDFNESVNVRSGFQPIDSIDTTKLTFKPCGSGTALYDAVATGLGNAASYRNNLENSGVNCKTLIFVITDGEDNSSKANANQVKTTLQNLLQGERNAFSFETILFEVGRDASFEQAKTDMGIHHLARIGQSGKEIRKMIGFISASISQSATGAAQIVF